MIQNTNYGASKSYVDGALSNTYTKAEVDTFLAAKANDNAVVHSTGNIAEDISGLKTFLSNPIAQGLSPQFVLKNTDLDVTVNPSATKYALIFTRDKNNAEVGSYGIRKYSDGITQWYTYIKKGSKSALMGISLNDNEAYAFAPTRGYNAGSTYANDVATVGTLDAYTPMVRNTGNQSISGTKTFLSDTQHGDSTHPDSSSLILWASGAYRRFRMRSNVDDVTTTPASNVVYGMINFSDKNDQTVCNIQLTHKSTGGYKLEAVIKTSDDNFNVFTIGETS